MEVQAVGRFLRCSPRKARLVIDQIRGQRADIGLAILRYSNKRASKLIAKILQSAMANAEENLNVRDTESLVVSKAFVDQGPTLKRFRPRSMGSASPIRKRTCHITVVLSEPQA